MNNLPDEILTLKELQDIKFIDSSQEVTYINRKLEEGYKLLAIERSDDGCGNSLVTFYVGAYRIPPKVH